MIKVKKKKHIIKLTFQATNKNAHNQKNMKIMWIERMLNEKRKTKKKKKNKPKSHN